MIILGLDLSSVSSGYAILEDGELKAYNTIKFKTKQKHGERLALFEIRLKEILAEFKPDLVACEDIFLTRNVRTFKALAFFQGAAKKVVWEVMGVEPLMSTPSELRKKIQKATGVVMTGKRKKNKLLAYNFIVKKYNLKDFTFDTHNDITDACAVALAASLPVVKRATKKEKAKAEALRLKAEARAEALIIRNKIKEEKALALAAARALKKELAKNVKKPKSV